jgi:ParB family transcriptional regulator, chromosome partitioning protein
MSSALGRGLDSLIPQKVKRITTSSGDTIIDVSSASDKDRILYVAPELISVNPEQPRKAFNEAQLEELAESIRLYGIIQPLVVTRKGAGYELIAGERRLRASRSLRLEKVPVIVREAGEQEKLELALIENIQREQLNPIETSIAYRKLIDEFGLTQDALAKRVGKARSSVANSLRLLMLPPEIQEALKEGRITEGHAKLIAGVEGEEKQLMLFRKIIHTGLSVSSAMAESKRQGGTKQARSPYPSPEDKERSRLFERFFGAKTEIKRRGKGGEIVICFFDDDELRGVMDKVK